MTIPETEDQQPSSLATDPEDPIERAFRDHVLFILQREREERALLDMTLREQVLSQIAQQANVLSGQMQALQNLQGTILEKWEAIRTTADTQTTEVQSRIAQMGEDIRKGTTPIREYQMHVNRLQNELQALIRTVKNNTREVAGVTFRALWGGALGGGAAAILIFLLLYLAQTRR